MGQSAYTPSILSVHPQIEECAALRCVASRRIACTRVMECSIVSSLGYCSCACEPVPSCPDVPVPNACTSPDVDVCKPNGPTARLKTPMCARWVGAHAATARGRGWGYDDVEVVSAGDSLDGHLLQSMHPHRPAPARHATEQRTHSCRRSRQQQHAGQCRGTCHCRRRRWIGSARTC